MPEIEPQIQPEHEPELVEAALGAIALAGHEAEPAGTDVIGVDDGVPYGEPVESLECGSVLLESHRIQELPHVRIDPPSGAGDTLRLPDYKTVLPLIPYYFCFE